MRIFVFTNMVTAVWTLIVFIIAIYSTDYYPLTNNKLEYEIVN